LLYLWADDDGVDLSSTKVFRKCSAASRGTAIGIQAFVPCHNQHTVSARLKRRRGKQRPDIRLQPGIGSRERSIVRVIL
jgi:hypothetical protein